MSIRPVKKIIQAQPHIEGAGVHLRRAFGFGATEEFDPRGQFPWRNSRMRCRAMSVRCRTVSVRCRTLPNGAGFVHGFVRRAM